MLSRCDNCRFYDWDYGWGSDIDDEYLIDICEEGRTGYLNSDEECPFFEKVKM